MTTTKYIQSVNGKHNYVIRIQKTSHSIKFRTPENYNRHAKRAMWLDGGEAYVLYKGAWYSVAEVNGDTLTILEYREVIEMELRSRAYRIANHRHSTNLCDYTWEEVTVIRCLADALGYDYYEDAVTMLDYLVSAPAPTTTKQEAAEEAEDTTKEDSTMTSETFEGKYCYFIRDESKGNPCHPCTTIGTCNADDHFQALDKFRRGLGTNGLESGHTYVIIRDAGSLGKMFCMKFVL